MEFNTMPGWAGSSWYFLRYLDPLNRNEFVSKHKVDYWKNVDLYIGGAEHATMHLLYARFVTKALRQSSATILIVIDRGNFENIHIHRMIFEMIIEMIIEMIMNVYHTCIHKGFYLYSNLLFTFFIFSFLST